MKHRFFRAMVFIFVLALALSLSSSFGAKNPRITGRESGRQSTPTPHPAMGVFSTLKWARSFGRYFPGAVGGQETDIASAAVPTGDGGVVMAGVASFATDPGAQTRSDLVVMEVRPSGQVAWQVLYDSDPTSPCYNDSFSLIRTSDGGYLVAGFVSKAIELARQALVMKLNHVGGVQWIKSYDLHEPDTEAFDAVELRDGGFIVALRSGGVLILKLDSAGNQKWNKTFGVDLRSLRPTPDGGFAAVGTANDGVARIVKLDGDGNIEWQKGYTLDPGWNCGDYDSRSYGLWIMSDGGYALAGETWGCDRASWAAWVCVLDAAGEIIRHRSFNYAFPQAFLQSRDGGFLMADYSALLKLTPDLEIEWQKSFPDFGIYSASETEDNGPLLSGLYIRAEGYDPRMAVLCLDPQGMIGQSCPVIRNAQIVAGSSSMNTVPVGPVAQRTKKVTVRSLQYTPYPRPCEVKTICTSAGSLFRVPLVRR